MLKHFKGAIVAAIVGFGISYFWGGITGVFVTLILSVLEISLSVDNAVLNAKPLGEMSHKWRRRYLTWGMFIAVFGMRVVFPLLVVSLSAFLGPLQVFDLAFNHPEEYAHHLEGAHAIISAFGGMFLLMVFLKFFFDEEKDVHWIHVLEAKLSRLGRLESSEIIFALIVLLSAVYFLPGEIVAGTEVLPVFTGGVLGLLAYLIIDSITGYFEGRKRKSAGLPHVSGVAKAGAATFFYLEMRDASFSFDGVIGAFAITTDIVLIAIGLGLGAFFLRSFTILLVERETLQAYRYLEHGAHYAIGALAFFMLLGVKLHVPEVLTGTVGGAVIALAVISSIKHRRA